MFHPYAPLFQVQTLINSPSTHPMFGKFTSSGGRTPPPAHSLGPLLSLVIFDMQFNASSRLLVCGDTGLHRLGIPPELAAEDFKLENTRER